MTTTTLSAKDKALLKQCEAKIERGLKHWTEVAEGLVTIRGQRLYRATHARFDDYIAERWGFSRNWANQMVRTYKIACTVSETGVPPVSQNSVISLEPIKDPTLQKKVWKQAVKESGGKAPTGGKVFDVANRIAGVGSKTLADAPKFVRDLDIMADRIRSYYSTAEIHELISLVMGGMLKKAA